MTTTQIGTITREQFDAIEQLPENANRRLQLIRGEIVEDMPKKKHVLISRRLNKLLNAAQSDQLWEILPEMRIDLPDDTFDARVVDICVVITNYEDFQSLDDEALPFMPDLCIEIQSPRQSDRKLIEAAMYYLDNGARMVWLFFSKRYVEVWTPDERRTLTIDETLNGGDVLPGFSVPVRDIFPAGE